MCGTLSHLSYITASPFALAIVSACEFRCEADDKCIKRVDVCNGSQHCSDGQDENDCGKMSLIYTSLVPPANYYKNNSCLHISTGTSY